MKQPIITYLIPELLSPVEEKVKFEPKIALLNSMDPQQLMYTDGLYYWEVKLRLFVCCSEKSGRKPK